MVILMTKRKQSLCQNKTGFDYQLNTLRISYFQRNALVIFPFFTIFVEKEVCNYENNE